MGKCLYKVFIEMPTNPVTFEKILCMSRQEVNKENPQIVLAKELGKQCFVIELEIEITEEDTEDELKVRQVLLEPCIQKVTNLLNVEEAKAGTIVHQRIVTYRLMENGTDN